MVVIQCHPRLNKTKFDSNFWQLLQNLVFQKVLEFKSYGALGINFWKSSKLFKMTFVKERIMNYILVYCNWDFLTTKRRKFHSKNLFNRFIKYSWDAKHVSVTECFCWKLLRFWLFWDFLKALLYALNRSGWTHHGLKPNLQLFCAALILHVEI